jgi:hypothetical protein
VAVVEGVVEILVNSKEGTALEMGYTIPPPQEMSTILLHLMMGSTTQKECIPGLVAMEVGGLEGDTDVRLE